MTRTLLTLSLFLLLPAALPAASTEERKPNPLAPSLPQLTDEEEEAIDRVIDRFILFDTGRLKGAVGKKALADFQKLGAESMFGLIRGLNKAARLEASCPALTIGKKLSRLLRASNDVQLLEFARENIGAGVGKSRHAAVLGDLRVLCMARKRVAAVNTAAAARARKKEANRLRSLSVDELTTAISEERGPRLKLLMSELASRRGDEAISALVAAADKDREVGPLARSMLVRNLSRLKPSALKEMLADERAEVRLAATRAVSTKRLRLGNELIDLLTDKSPEVRKAARQALVKLGRGADYGPFQDASETERSEAIKKWRAWWSKQKAR